MLAAAISAPDDAEVLGAVAAGSILVALEMLGAPVFRVSVAIAVGLACAAGFSFSCARATRAEGCCGLIVLEAIEGISDAFALVT